MSVLKSSSQVATLEARCALGKSRDPQAREAAEQWHEQWVEQYADEYRANAKFLDDYDRDRDRLLRKRMAVLYDQVTRLGGLLPTEAVIDGAEETSTM